MNVSQSITRYWMVEGQRNLVPLAWEREGEREREELRERCNRERGRERGGKEYSVLLW